jgi:DNA-binding transcriptional MerR regulator
LVSGLVAVGAARWFHEHQPTPSSTLEVNMSDRDLTIGELAKRTGVATSALRYYEELGLLPAPVRVSGQRRYPESAVGLVGTILLLRDVGFSLGESKAVLASRPQAVDSWRSHTQRKLADLDEQIAKARPPRKPSPTRCTARTTTSPPAPGSPARSLPARRSGLGGSPPPLSSPPIAWWRPRPVPDRRDSWRRHPRRARCRGPRLRIG